MHNGDNLLAVHDADVATAFAIEALLLVDHYNFLDRYATPKTGGKVKASAKGAAAKPTVAKQPRSKQQAAVLAKMFLSTTDKWAQTYFDSKDLHSMERELFG
jgi:hypothetical protein